MTVVSQTTGTYNVPVTISSNTSEESLVEICKNHYLQEGHHQPVSVVSTTKNYKNQLVRIIVGTPSQHNHEYSVTYDVPIF